MNRRAFFMLPFAAAVPAVATKSTLPPRKRTLPPRWDVYILQGHPHPPWFYASFNLEESKLNDWVEREFTLQRELKTGVLAFEIYRSGSEWPLCSYTQLPNGFRTMHRYVER
jgi:hypothetical protein